MSTFDAMIIGGGASGLMAASRLARGGARVLLLEQSDRVGRKLLATGNGRCNMLNMRLERGRYFSRDIGAAWDVLRRYPPERLLDEFGALGVMTRCEDDGRVYPLSGQAASVLDALRLACTEAGVRTETGAVVARVLPLRGTWRARLDDGREYCAERVVLACGGRAQPTLPANRQARGMDMLEVLRALGHAVYAPAPVLTPLKCDMSGLKGLKGVRVRGALELSEARTGRRLAREDGEILFADYGISGIAAMQLSRAACGRGAVRLALDMLPDMDAAALRELLAKRARGMAARPAEAFLTGVLNRLLAGCVLRRAGIAPGRECGALSADELNALTAALKHFEVDVTGAQDYASAQVMRGGAALNGFDAALESLFAPGLHACGELLDVDGECGGYNLMWAWASALAVADGVLGAGGRRRDV